VPVELSYTRRNRTNRIAANAPIPRDDFADAVIYSIRGDLRDFLAARKLLPGAVIRMTGWSAFLGRRIAIMDWALKRISPGVMNRYKAWCSISGTPFQDLVASYTDNSRRCAGGRQGVAIHIGAQWRSKQYPKVAGLRDALKSRGIPVEIWAGPGDPLPSGLSENEVIRLDVEGWISGLRRIALSIVNDSGPMHFSALLGTPTLALSLASNIHEWTPPETRTVCSPRMPTGYRPLPEYQSDAILPGWPDKCEIIDCALAMLVRSP
jgi:hypothetical protein